MIVALPAVGRELLNHCGQRGGCGTSLHGGCNVRQLSDLADDSVRLALADRVAGHSPAAPTAASDVLAGCSGR